MILKDNFCHADMHPGNVFLTLQKKKEGAGSWFNTALEARGDSLDDESYSSFAHASVKEQRELLQGWHDQGYTPGLLLLDAGLVSHLSPPQFSSLVQIFEAGLSFDGARVADLVMAESRFPKQILDPNGVRQELQSLLKTIELDGNGSLMLSKLSASQIVTRFADLVRNHHIGMHGEYVGLFLSCLTVEGIGKSLGADFDLLPVISF
jgi:aarF domain-containing kinase